jgi:predicted GIY-YIG superfamily endonuclease
MYFCYLLQSGNKTYIGYTVNLARRIRQHKGEIKGGAKYTRQFRGNLSLVVYVTGFLSKRDALQFEWRWKKKTKGLSQRVARVREMIQPGQQWTRNSIPTSDERRVGHPLTLHLPPLSVSSGTAPM